VVAAGTGPLAVQLRMGSGIVGGTDRALANLAVGLHSLGEELHLAVIDDGRTDWELLRAFFAGVPMTLHRVPAVFRFDPLTSFRLKRLVGQLGAAVVHSWDYKSDVIAALATPLPWIATLHGVHSETPRLRLYQRLDRLALRHARRVFAVSETLAASLGGRRGVRLVPNVVPAATRPPRSAVVQPRRLVAIGRMEEEKGFDLLLEAFAACLSEVPGMCLTLVGDGSLRPALEEQAHRLGLGDAVRFAGWLADVVTAFDAADLLVISSRREQQPMVLLEGMARGLPAVVTAVGEMTRLVETPVTGLVVTPGDAQALAAGILRAARSTFDGAAAWARVRRDHAPERLASIYLDTYRTVAPSCLGAART
jgi:glycosyltransferase involved in cell wall biosynthesis